MSVKSFSAILIILLMVTSAFAPATAAFSAATTATPTAAAPVETPEKLATTYQAIANRFFAILQDQGSEEALEYVFSTNPYSKRMSDQLSMVSNQLSAAEGMMGDYLGYELLVETKVADRLVNQYYMVLYKRQPLRFELTFYRPADEWVFQNFAFNADIIQDISSMTHLALLQSDKVQFSPKRLEQDVLAYSAKNELTR